MSLRIAMISEHASPLAQPGGVDSGGQNVYVARLAHELALAGHDVDIFTRRDAPDLPEVVEAVPGVRVVHVPAGPPAFVAKEALLPLMPGFEAWVRRFITSGRGSYDLVHANFFMSGLVAAGLKRSLGLPFVVTFHALGLVRRMHQGAADAFPQERCDIEHRVIDEAAAVIAACPNDRRDLITLYGADPSRIRLAPCGFDPGEMWPLPKQEARRHLGLPGGMPIVLQLGRLVPRKGVDDAIRGFARARLPHGARMLVVGGEGPDGDEARTPEIGRLRAIAREECVEQAVTFTGSRPRDVLRYYYSAADAFVTTPWYEPFGITPIEAMACGTPVVGAAVGGIQSTIVDGVTGSLVPPRDPDAIAGALAELVRDPARRAAMARNGIIRANAHFTWRQVAERVAAIYADVCGGALAAMDDTALVHQRFSGTIAALQGSRDAAAGELVQAAALMTAALGRGAKVLVCGNGGSAADAQHFATELMGRFRTPGRRALPAIALCADTAFLTAWSNDFEFADVFARQVEALGNEGDVLVAISTSGRSPNVVHALETARGRGLRTIAFVGGDGGPAGAVADAAVVVPSFDCQHIQEAQIAMIHVLCELVERAMLAAVAAPAEVKVPRAAARRLPALEEAVA